MGEVFLSSDKEPDRCQLFTIASPIQWFEVKDDDDDDNDDGVSTRQWIQKKRINRMEWLTRYHRIQHQANAILSQSAQVSSAPHVDSV